MIQLRTHSHYSIKRAYGNPTQLLEKAKSLGMTHLGLTDYGRDHGFPYFWQESKKLGIQMLYGIEFYITSDMTKKGKPDFSDINFKNDTIILMAKNYEGYTELLRILSTANHPENYFMVPRIDFEYMAEEINPENLVCLMPYDSGSIPKLLMQNDIRNANTLTRMFKGLFGEDFYFEISANVSEVNKIVNERILKHIDKNNIKGFASTNVHYPNKEDKKVHDILLAMGEKKTFAENDLYTLGSDDNYLRDDESVLQGLHKNEIEERLGRILIENTEEIAAKCSFDLVFAPMSLPNTNVILPEEYQDKQVEYFLAELEKGWQDLIVPRIDSGEWDEIKSEQIPVYEERRDYEFNMIKDIFTMKDANHPMVDGFIDYFLIVADYIKWAKGIDRRIMHDAPIIEVGPARGSVSGSLIGYLTKMSTVDPIPWGLTFERFINPERVSWPDIDMDFSPDTAWWLEKYLIATYGEDHVAHILTFQTAAGKTAFSNVSKIMSGKYGKYKTEVKSDRLKGQNELNKLLQIENSEARRIQDMIDSNRKLKDQLNPDAVDPDGNSLYNKELHEISKLSAYKELFEIIQKIEGTVMSTGSHPGAVIITREPLWKYTARTNNGKYPDNSIMLTTSYEKYALEEVNTMKFDILRLAELVIVRETLKFIKESTGEDINLDKINPFDIESNLKILQLMKDGDLDGVFQFSSHLYKTIIEEVIGGIEDRSDEDIAQDLFNIIIALEALGRPGPLNGGMVPTFAKGLADPNSIERVHPDVDEILNETYGNMLYQEQVMFILRKLGGFSLGQADMVRRGIASGKREKIEEQRKPFMDGVEKTRLDKQPDTTEEEMEALLKLADHIFNLMAFWSEYGFNKAHSVGYGFLSLRGAYLKANYKEYFMAALLSSNSGDEVKVSKYIDEIRARGIKVLPPKMNKSLRGFTVVDGEILFGLEAIKGVGAKAIEKIIAGYPYNNIMDFIQKVGTRTIIPPLIKAGYFKEDKRFLLKYYEVLIEIKDGKTKTDESLVEYLLENDINESTQDNIGKRLDNIIYEKSLKKRTEKTKRECLELIHQGEWSSIGLLNAEKEVLGMFLSESPLDRYRDIIVSSTTLCNNIKGHKVNEEFYVIGMVLETPKKVQDRNGKDMCFLKLQMYDGILELPIFAGTYKKYFFQLVGGNVIISHAKKIRGGVTLNKITNLSEKEKQFREFFGVGVTKK